jgi:hypothetical protein
MTDTYQHWVERVVGGRDAKPLANGEVVKSSAGEPFGVIEFVRVKKDGFVAELGKKSNHYIYHFYPSDQYMMGTRFEDIMTDVLLELFKREDQIEVDWVPEMKAWAVRISGWTDSIWGDDMAVRAIHRLDEALRGATT